MAQVLIKLVKDTITDIYAASGIDTAKTLIIQNIGGHGIYLSVNSDMVGGQKINPGSGPWGNLVPGSAYALSDQNCLLSVSDEAFKPIGQTGELLPVGVFRGIRAITSQGFAEANVKNGTQFYTHWAYPLANPIAAGASVYFLFTTGTTPVIFMNRIVSAYGEEFQHEIFVGPTVTDPGTALTPGNYGGAAAVASTVTISRDATVSADGTASDDEPEYYFGSGAAPQRSTSAFQEGIQRRLGLSTTYAVKITNNGSSSGRFQWYGTWHEGEIDLPRPAGEIS